MHLDVERPGTHSTTPTLSDVAFVPPTLSTSNQSYSRMT
ncbi:hypothetical protein M0802_004117 [Mischocyttarus mexicanus]|nr:hypothetical protein M0802_004117 [Mischocyttarus mexicanus]